MSGDDFEWERGGGVSLVQRYGTKMAYSEIERDSER